MTRLLEYGSTPSAPGAVAQAWPRESGLVRRPGYPTLVMLAHPHCPCTRASLGELEIVAARAEGLLDMHVVFLASAALDHRGDLWRQALRIPGVDVVADAGGAEIDRFGVTASGHVLVYDQRGILAFSGGITSSRGHAGGNVGRDAIIELARAGRSGVSAAHVFGCALYDRRQQPQRQRP